MDKLKNRIFGYLSKYKYVVVVILIGVLLMLWPTSKENTEVLAMNSVQGSKYEDIETRLENIIKLISGAGEVKVLLTVAEGEKIRYQQNQDVQNDNNSNTSRSDTVIISDNQRNESGLIQQIDPPQYMGAVVVCTGADDPRIKLSIIEAVSNATGLRTDKISVLKMK